MSDPFVPRRVRNPFMSLRNYDDRAKLCDEIFSLTDSLQAAKKAVSSLSEADPADAKTEAENAVTLIESQLAGAQQKLTELGGPVGRMAEMQRNEQQTQETAAPSPPPESLPGPPDMPQEIRISLFRFRTFQKRVQQQAEKIASADRPVAVVLGELDAFFSRQGTPK